MIIFGGCQPMIRGVFHHHAVYALTHKNQTPSKPLKINFYEHPESSHRIIGTLLSEAGKNSIYIERFLSVDMPGLGQLKLKYKPGRNSGYAKNSGLLGDFKKGQVSDR